MKRSAPLDGLRGIAILIVIAGHGVTNLADLDGTLRTWMLSWIEPGIGVRLFFGLSGYLITTLLLEENQRTGAIGFRVFYLRRARRILPAYWSYLLLIAGWTVWGGNAAPPESWVAAFTFSWNYAALWSGWTAAASDWNLGHLWSLCVEGQFYLIWPAVFVWFGPRRAAWTAGGLLLLGPFIRVATYFLFPAQRGMTGMMLHTGFDGLAAGCAVAVWAHFDPRFRERLRTAAPWGATAALLWFLVLAPLGRHLIDGFDLIAGFSGDAVVSAWAVASAHRLGEDRPWRILGKGLMPKIGVISYSLYLWQQPWFGPDGLLTRGHVVLPMVGAVICAVVSYRFIERPFLRAFSADRRIYPVALPDIRT